MNTGGGSSVLCTPSKNSVSLNEPEGMDTLLPKLLGMLSLDKISGMMTVRKGRVSIHRNVILSKGILIIFIYTIPGFIEAHFATHQRSFNSLGHLVHCVYVIDLNET